MSRISFFCTTMRRFFHRKTSQTRPGTTATTPTNGGRPRSTSTSSSSTNSPVHGPATATGRVRAPNLRSRSMSVLNGPAISAGTPNARRFTRSLSFCAENQMTNTSFTRQLTKSEEDEVFRTYTRRVYGLFGVLCAIIVGIAAYAYLYNYGNR